ncbi:MAG TPA: prepilin-type N-terminal cleavage/methylation domain-containing protein [Kofleriaceae bacterium]|jgi:general secretion pathway protein G|nr:prepilin-type N-terminal cleavage/methylation domain-containing protein [Kofleriaceae bacterium]
MQTLRNRLSRLSRALARALARAPGRAGGRAQRGMTLLEIMIVLAILALVMGLLVGPKVMKMFGESRIDTTKIKLKKYAFEAYPSWAAAHPDKQCPGNISELNEYMNGNDSNDSWGRPIKMLCGANVPAGARGIALVSAGEDGKEGTEDDLKSWE